MAFPRSLTMLGLLVALGHPALARSHHHHHAKAHTRKTAPTATTPAPATATAPAADAKAAPGAGAKAPTAAAPVARPARAPRAARWKAWSLAQPKSAPRGLDDEPLPPPAEPSPAVAAAAPALTRSVVLSPPPRMILRLGAEAGYQRNTSEFTGNGQSELSHYKIAAPALMARLHGDFAWRTRPGLLVGAQLDYLIGSWTGIRYAAGSGQTADIPYLTHDSSGAVTAAYDFGDLSAGVHLGYDYRAGLTPKLDNLARLPREALAGATAGIDLEARRLGPASVRLSGDFLVPGPWTWLAQTSGLADGTHASATSAWGTLSVSYPVARGLALEAGARVAWTRAEFSGASQRVPGVTAATRTDFAVAGLVGAAGRF